MPKMQLADALEVGIPEECWKVGVVAYDLMKDTGLDTFEIARLFRDYGNSVTAEADIYNAIHKAREAMRAGAGE